MDYGTLFTVVQLGVEFLYSFYQPFFIMYFVTSSLAFFLMVLYISAYFIRCLSSPFSTISRYFVIRACVRNAMQSVAPVSISDVGSGGRAVERRTVNRGDGGSIPPTAVSKLRQFLHPTFACVFRKRH